MVHAKADVLALAKMGVAKTALTDAVILVIEDAQFNVAQLVN